MPLYFSYRPHPDIFNGTSFFDTGKNLAVHVNNVIQLKSSVC